MTAPRVRRSIDGWSAGMALVTVLALAWFAWERLKPTPPQDPPAVGAVPPLLHLVDPETREPLVLLGLHGKVVWITFWSPNAPDGAELLEALEGARKRLHARGRFAMIAAATDRGRPETLQAAAKHGIPIYLATAQTQRAYGAVESRLPLHFLIDDDGRVGVIAQGAKPETIARLARQVGLWLDALEPFGDTHFAQRGRDRIPRIPAL